MVRGFKTGIMIFTSNSIFFYFLLEIGITIEKKCGITIRWGREDLTYDARSFRNCKLLKVGWDKSIEIVIAALFFYCETFPNKVSIVSFWYCPIEKASLLNLSALCLVKRESRSDVVCFLAICYMQ